MIHETAVIDASAKIGKNVSIGPYSVIGPQVEIGEGTWIGPHVVIQGPTRLGKHNKIYQFASVGEAPQDLKFKGEETWLEMGDHNTVREFVTINRGTAQDHAVTKIGDHNLFMAYVHIAHDCVIGNHTVFSNNASLAGHVTIEDYVVFGGFSGVSQFCRVGAHSFVATNAVVIKDVPPYVLVSGHYAKPYGLNTVGLQRRGFSEPIVNDIKRAYKVLYRQGLKVSEAVAVLRETAQPPEVNAFLQFIEQSKGGIVR
ncbi:MAG TPA: acyl-ACP--UDP-N-acetylglucosamine O-acyltransferase [Gammaproteobacteria bacterium]|nr:acyl-ACP--UDP-N-acetylglucosamine O-acyltransferase [Gammaproteobacteria bacterium]